MFKPNQLELAWLAGFFDGEGTIVFRSRRNGSSRTIAVSISQAGEHAPELLNRVANAVGFGKVYTFHRKVRKSNYKQQEYAWRVDSFEKAQAFVGLVWKFLGPAKRIQAEKALRDYCAAMGKT